MSQDCISSALAEDCNDGIWMIRFGGELDMLHLVLMWYLGLGCLSQLSKACLIYHCRTKQWMSDGNDKWQGKPMLFLPANEAAASQWHRPPGLVGFLKSSIGSRIGFKNH